MFHQARVVTVLLYSNDSWAVSLSALNDIESFHVEATRRMTGMHLQRRNVWPWIYPTSMDVFTVARLKLVTAYIRPRRHNITKTSIVRASLKEYRGAERRSGSSSRLMWWQQEMDLEEDDNGADGGGRGVVFPRRFYDEAGSEVGADQGQGVIAPDPRERYMNRPVAAPGAFNRGVDLYG